MSARLLLLLLAFAPLLVAGEPAPPLRSIAEAPWYDPQADTWRRVVPPEPEPEEDREDGSAPGTPLFAYAMYALVALAIGLLVAQLWRMRGAWSELDAGPRPAAPPATTLSALPFALPGPERDPEDALRAALAAGDFALAVVWLYALQLVRLDAAAAIRLAAGKTNRAYLRETAAALPAAAPALAATVALFERSHFGHLAPTRGEVEAVLARHRELVAALPAAGAGS